MSEGVRKDMKRGTWEFVIELAPDPATGRRRQLHRRGFPTKKAARDAWKALVAESADGSYITPSSQPVRVYLERWLTSVELTRKPSTAAKYGEWLRRYVIPRIGAMPLRAVDTATLEELYAELRTGGGRNGQPLGDTTVMLVHNALSRALGDAARRQVIQIIPRSMRARPGLLRSA